MAIFVNYKQYLVIDNFGNTERERSVDNSKLGIMVRHLIFIPFIFNILTNIIWWLL